MHCVGGHTLVSVPFVAVLITLYLLKLFHYFFQIDSAVSADLRITAPRIVASSLDSQKAF